MTKIYLSPSTQEHNAYKGGGNEEVEMRQIVTLARPYLVAAGYDVKVGGTVSAANNVREGNAWGADIYVAVHSNAGGGDGTVAFYHSNSPRGKRLATELYKAMAPSSPGKDDGVKANDGLIEIHGPKAPAALIEVEFHDSKSGADWIKGNEGLIGKELARGILAYYGKSITTPVKPKPKPRPMPILRQGMRNAAVRTLQTLLNKFGYKLIVDGDFGANTNKAVRAFQKAHKLTIDGIVGAITWKALMSK